MTWPGLVLAGLRHHWRMHAGAAAGTALAAAILTGALLVGDSTDHTLRQHAFARLGDIHYAVESRGGFFSQELAEAAANALGTPVAPTLTLPGMALNQGQANQSDRSDPPDPPDPVHQVHQVHNVHQVNQVAVIGTTPAFWHFSSEPPPALGPYETALNEHLAQTLGVGPGDQVGLRFSKPGILPRDAPLSSRAEDNSVRALCTVKAVLPDSGIGRFSLAATQAAPHNAFVDLRWLQEQAGLGDRVDSILIGEGADTAAIEGALADAWLPEHTGLRLRAHPDGILQLETERIFLRKAVADAALALPGATGTVSYLVNAIAFEGRSTPYSFATAGPVPPDMPDDHALVNRWLADAIGAETGDTVHVRYFELTPANDFIERERTFTVHGILEMDALAAERDLMPEFPGLTDVERCEDWDIGMPLDDEQLEDPANEAYWNEHGPTPKILFTLAAGQEMWANRFGELMTVRFPSGTTPESAVREALHRDVTPADLGLITVPVRQQALDAVGAALDLGGLFIGMSFFLIVSALVLTALLFVFGVQQRAAEAGVLLALGFRPGHVRALLLAEAAAGAVLGAAAGALAGSVYTRALIFGLNHQWRGAVADTRIVYHAAPGTVLTGALVSLICALVAMTFAMWRQARHAPRELLTTDFSQSAVTGKSGQPSWWLPLAGYALAAVLIARALATGATDVSLVFFGAGALMLVSGVGLFRCILARMTVAGSANRLTLRTLAIENAARRRGRSLSVAALLATGCFLVLAVSSMQQDVAANADNRSSGTGGFALFAETTLPLSDNPADGIGVPGIRAVPLRVRDGDDANCLNLNRAQTPRLIGVDAAELARLGAFSGGSGGEGPWGLLGMQLPDGAVPALVGDADTVMWGLQKKTGVEDGDVLVYLDDQGNEVVLKLVGHLPMRLSVFQGSVLIANDAFTRLFPSEDGFRAFLVDAPPDEHEAVALVLNKAHERSGMHAEPAVDRLRRFYAVESTYLAMFLLLGGFGVILGTAALGIVVLRNLIERRREIAMLCAVGFPTPALFRLYLAEYAFLLGAGILIGGLAAAVAMVPAHAFSGTPGSLPLQAAMLAGMALAGLACILLAVRTALADRDFTALRAE